MSTALRAGDSKKIAVLFYTSGMAGRHGGTAFSEALLASSLSHTADLTLIGRRGRNDVDFVRGHGLDLRAEFTGVNALSALVFSKHPLRLLVRSADIVHINGHWSLSASFLARVCEKERIPYVVHPRGMLIVGIRSKTKKKWFNRLIGFRTVRNAAKVIALSRFELRQFTPYDLPPNRLSVIPNGIVSGGADIPVSGKKPYFLYLGRLEARKNLTSLVVAFVEHRRRNPNTSLVFIGPIERGYDEVLRKSIETNGVSDSIQILPAVFGEEKRRWLCGARAVIYPSFEEAFGRVPFEAIAAGVYPIIPAESGSAEYLASLLPFCLFALNDTESLVKALDRLGGDVSAEARQSLEVARRWVAEELAPHHVASKIQEVYAEILKRN